MRVEHIEAYDGADAYMIDRSGTEIPVYIHPYIYYGGSSPFANAFQIVGACCFLVENKPTSSAVTMSFALLKYYLDYSLKRANKQFNSNYTMEEIDDTVAYKLFRRIGCTPDKNDYNYGITQSFLSMYLDDILKSVPNDFDFVRYARSLQNILNEQYCKVRVGDPYKIGVGDKGDVYFRISSTSFNWYSIIKDFIYSHRGLKTITVERDSGAPDNGKGRIYHLGRDELYRVPIIKDPSENEFCFDNLDDGNLSIESFDINNKNRVIVNETLQYAYLVKVKDASGKNTIGYVSDIAAQTNGQTDVFCTNKYNETKVFETKQEARHFIQYCKKSNRVTFLDTFFNTEDVTFFVVTIDKWDVRNKHFGQKGYKYF